MNKLLCILIAVCLLLCLCACGEGSAPPFAESAAPSSETGLSTSETELDPDSLAHEAKTPAETHPPRRPTLDIGEPTAFSYRDENSVIRAIGMVRVDNKTDEALALSPCEMEFYDADGAFVCKSDSVFAYPPVIEPGETAYYYEQVEPDLADTVALTLNVSVPNPDKAEPVRYEVSEETVTDSPYGGLVVSGKVFNPTEQDAELVCVAAVLFDEFGEPLAVVQTVLMEPLTAGETKDFYIEDFLLPTELAAQAVASIQTYAYPL